MGNELVPQITYRTIGELPKNTTLDEKLADGFVKACDLKRRVIIVNTDQQLGWFPVGDPRRLHILQRIGSAESMLLINSQLIEERIRETRNISGADLEAEHLKQINQEVKAGLADELFSEKMGYKDQWVNWTTSSFFPVLALNELLHGRYQPAAMIIAGSVVVTPFYNLYETWHNRRMQRDDSLDQPFIIDRTCKEALFPSVPVHQWLRGRRFLAKHQDLIISAKTV